MKLVQPTMLDLLMLTAQARDDEIEQYEALVGAWNRDDVAAEFYAKFGVKFALINDDGMAVCAGGWDRVIDGVYQSWMVGTMDYWEKYWRSITKYSRFTMNQLLANGARRLQTGALASRTKTCEWYERGLKMKRESVFKNFGRNGEDMVMFVRLKESNHG